MDTRKVEAALAKKYGYKKQPDDLSAKYRQWFAENIPTFLTQTNHQTLYSDNGLPICVCFDRIVIGDYGAFVEFDPVYAVESNFIICPGQEYRINDPKYSHNVKYEWYTVPFGNIKIYKQKRRVVYADYCPGKYYVSVHEVHAKQQKE